MSKRIYANIGHWEPYFWSKLNLTGNSNIICTSKTVIPVLTTSWTTVYVDQRHRQLSDDRRHVPGLIDVFSCVLQRSEFNVQL